MASVKSGLRLKFEDVVPMMMSEIGAKKDGDLALYLGISSQALSNQKKRGFIPAEWVMSFALKAGIPVEKFIKNKEALKQEAPKPVRADESIPLPERREELPGLTDEAPRIADRRQYAKIRKMIEVISRSEVTMEALPELLHAGLPNITPMILRQRYIDTHSLNF